MGLSGEFVAMLLNSQDVHVRNQLTQRINELTQRTNELLEENARLEEQNVIDTIFMCQTQLKQQKLDDIKKSAHMMCAEKSYELRRRRQLARDIRKRVTEELTSAGKVASASPLSLSNPEAVKVKTTRKRNRQRYSPEHNLKSRGPKDNDNEKTESPSWHGAGNREAKQETRILMY